MAVCTCTTGIDMTEEDEAFEELSRKQGYWGLQGSRKHQILRYAENVESKENITQDEIIKMARQAGLFTHKEVQPEIVAFAKLIAEKTLAQRTWLGLTQKEVQETHDTFHKRMGPQEFASMIEAKLKEKNT